MVEMCSALCWSISCTRDRKQVWNFVKSNSQVAILVTAEINVLHLKNLIFIKFQRYNNVCSDWKQWNPFSSLLIAYLNHLYYFKSDLQIIVFTYLVKISSGNLASYSKIQRLWNTTVQSKLPTLKLVPDEQNM